LPPRRRLRYETGVNDVRLSVPTLLMIVAVASAAAFAAGRSMPSDPGAAYEGSDRGTTSPPPTTEPSDPSLPPGHVGVAATGAPAGLPPNHPPIETANGGGAPEQEGALSWKVPPRWQLVPSTSSMRMATYRVPRVTGDTADPELSIVRAGGTVDANIQRWIGQFDAAGQKTAKRSSRTVAGLEVSIVELTGTYNGGMMKDPTPMPDWTLLGAVVPMGETPYFFKLTGPMKSVAAAHAEFDTFVSSLKPRSD
jgi:hypothetical protein